MTTPTERPALPPTDIYVIEDFGLGDRTTHIGWSESSMHAYYDAGTAPLRAENEAQARRIKELEAEVRSLKPDAERYRWVRDGEMSADYPYPVMRYGSGSLVDDHSIWAEELDAAIDAHLAPSTAPHGGQAA